MAPRWCSITGSLELEVFALQIQAELMGKSFPQCRWEESGAARVQTTKL